MKWKLFYDAKTMFKSSRLNRSHFTVGVTRRLLLSSRVSSLVINLITIRERVFKERTIKKLMGGRGGGGEVQKKYSRKGKLNEKNSCTPINPKKIFMLWPKKTSYKEFDNEENFLRL